MAHPYELKLREEISQFEKRIEALKTEKDRLEAKLAGFREALVMFTAMPVETKPAAPVQDVIKKMPARRGKGTGVFRDILDEIRRSDEKGLTIGEMFDFAMARNLRIKRHSIRSQVWTYKTSGVLEHVGDRYRIRKAEAPNGVQPSGASVLN